MTALLVALVLVSIVPLALLHFNLIRINRDALETAEKKYLKNSSVTLAESFDTYITNAQSQLKKIADGIRLASSMSHGSRSSTSRRSSSCASTPTPSRASRSSGPSIATASRRRPIPRALDPDVERPLRQAYNAAMRGDVLRGRPDLPASPFRTARSSSPCPFGRRRARSRSASSRRCSRSSSIKAKLDEAGQGGVLAYVVDRSGTLILRAIPRPSARRTCTTLDLVSEFIAHPVRITKTYMRGEGRTARRVLGTLATIPSPDWGVIVEKDEARAYASVAQMTEGVLASRRVLAARSPALVALVAARLLAHPLVDLVEKVRSIAEGNFKQRVDGPRRPRARGAVRDVQLHVGLDREVGRQAQAARPRRTRSCSSTRSGRSRPRSTRRTRTRAATRSASPATPSSSRATWTSRPRRCASVRLSALLHDVGKIGIDDRILRKPTALTSEEFEVMKTHPVKGALIMGQIPQLKDVIPGIKHHHEKWAGGGLPGRVEGRGHPARRAGRRRGGHVRRDDDDASLPEGHAAHLRHHARSCPSPENRSTRR